MGGQGKILVSVVIPTYNRLRTLQKTIAHIRYQTFPSDKYEIIVVDDHSKDGTKEYLYSIKNDLCIKIEVNKQNCGRAVTRNRGADIADGEHIIFIDDDIWTTNQFIEEHYKLLKNINAKGCSVGAVLVSKETPRTVLNEFYNNHHKWCYKEMFLAKDNLPFYFCKTANLAIPKKIFTRIGSFDEKYIQYGSEDTDLGKRLTKKGYPLHFCSQAIGYHYHDETIDKFIRKETEKIHTSRVFDKIHANERIYNSGSFFVAGFNKGRGIKVLVYNALKYILFRNTVKEVNRTVLRLCNNCIDIRNIFIRYIIPILRIQCQYLEIARINADNR